MNTAGRRTAIVGGGWAGMAAAVTAVDAGDEVHLFEMAPQLGGRARSLPLASPAHTTAGLRPPHNSLHRLDNGQHILIGAYTATLGLMRRVGVNPDVVLQRMPLTLLNQDGVGLRLAQGHPVRAFTQAVWTLRHWTLGERWALNRAALGWLLRRFRCPEPWTVAQLTEALPNRVRQELIDPLCVAALNTPAEEASAAVFLRVLQDALFAGPGASDLLVPCRPLADVLPTPTLDWLRQHGASVHLGHRCQTLQIDADAALPTLTPLAPKHPQGNAGWRLDGERFDRVILACTASEAARLTQGCAPAWSAQAGAFSHEPIITGYVRAPGARLAAPMVALTGAHDTPAQFAFDHGALGLQAERFALVISGAGPWISNGLEVTGAALLRQARAVLAAASPPTWHAETAVTLEKVVAEKRATFRCVPGLDRPSACISPGLLAAGDYVQGPYPATLEGAVRSGMEAAQH